MAPTFHLPQNSVHSLKRHLKSLQSGNHLHEEILRSVIESNLHTQQSVNELVSAIKSVAEEEPEKQEKHSEVAVPQTFEPNSKAKGLDIKLDTIIQQNYQLIQVVTDLIKHLRKQKPESPMPPAPPVNYTGIYPMRPLK